METATFGGGCFWCMDAVFRRVRGVVSVTAGYSGGTVPNPTMEEVYRGDTGHAECIQVVFDPSVVTYGQLTEIFFHLHDPTTTDRQGNDIGPEYRSVIFYHSQSQKEIAEAAVTRVNSSGIYTHPIVTHIAEYSVFYPAHASQQKYYEKNSYQPYCQYVIDPKITSLMKNYGDLVKSEYKAA